MQQLRFTLIALLLISGSAAASNEARVANHVQTSELHAAPENDIGFQQIRLHDDQRPLTVSLWYPAQRHSGTPTRLGDNPVFHGVPVLKEARLSASKPLPLIVMSHGYRGNWRNLNWLAATIARQGYLVAAPDHPGTTTFDTDPEQAAQWWQRPRDLSRTLDWLLASPAYGSHIDPRRIGAIGHSQGGWTVVSLAGGQVSSTYLAHQCRETRLSNGCGLITELGLSQDSDLQGRSRNLGLHDPRITAIISLDLGLANSFTPQSLAAITVPTLLLAAGVNNHNLPQALESGYLARHLDPRLTDYQVQANATHSTFMGRCKPGGKAIVEEEAPGEGKVCDSIPGTTRAREHQAIARHVTDFLARHL
ncbi:alpha/beta hydrolase family protein [Photobacterium ganghwense]|uniref:alpha/beta hydrolase family protein n=1 Tax=Photobacterium ganghwense TaxID=320778 RepID=UPI001C2DAB69|nr:CocE/NonD family hydrolase [Photobacterium ganghwense]MBV1842671.1 dienelactone hydrolase family protein [Photobacterium ganghwense]